MLTGGTDVHLVLVDLRNSALDGQQAEDLLHDAGITVNRNAVPFDPRPPRVTSGLRIGTPALASRGFGGHTGPRGARPFVDVNCAAIPETLIEAELFGYERGAFTDARQAKPGLFQLAHTGTIFLDEIGLLPEAVQAKLLKVIEERAVRRLGATRGEPVDIAILSATNEDLGAAVREGRFRADLYHRLAVLTLALPALRERGDDVLALADHYLGRRLPGLRPSRPHVRARRPDGAAALFLARQRPRAAQRHRADGPRRRGAAHHRRRAGPVRARPPPGA